jgi:hypothetical protein
MGLIPDASLISLPTFLARRGTPTRVLFLAGKSIKISSGVRQHLTPPLQRRFCLSDTIRYSGHRSIQCLTLHPNIHPPPLLTKRRYSTANQDQKNAIKGKGKAGQKEDLCASKNSIGGIAKLNPPPKRDVKPLVYPQFDIHIPNVKPPKPHSPTPRLPLPDHDAQVLWTAGDSPDRANKKESSNVKSRTDGKGELSLVSSLLLQSCLTQPDACVTI